MLEHKIQSKQMTVFIASDKSEWLENECAENHERNIQLKKWADGVGLCCGGEWSQSMVLNAMIEDRDKLAGLLISDKKFSEMVKEYT